MKYFDEYRTLKGRGNKKVIIEVIFAYSSDLKSISFLLNGMNTSLEKNAKKFDTGRDFSNFIHQANVPKLH